MRFQAMQMSAYNQGAHSFCSEFFILIALTLQTFRSVNKIICEVQTAVRDGTKPDLLTGELVNAFTTH